ncbi:BamA/TamA family outer membrane protein [Ferrimonas lipolytica]|uniref:BamA/TamA family outer membrane protein n=1 Tax=Ferrimonas lipolytica TaxID=2724191 RepID=A0A6H1UD46_9GAMM|nr:BamA/TamA family outer membrane protein [Ferrimonas lipolytica]QIZ76964.1 BamA/TamA family outer membrane protein [Ferrimonas lipolytica]
MEFSFLSRRLAHTLVLTAVALPAAAEQFTTTTTTEDKILPWEWADTMAKDTLNWLGADGEFDPSKGVDWGLVPGPIYSPEKQFGIGISAVGLFVADETMMDYAPSSITVKGYGTTNGSIGTEMELRSHYKHDSERLYIDAEIMDAPDLYYGVGIRAGRDDNNEIEFDRTTYRIAPQYLWRVATSTYAGIGFDFRRSESNALDPKVPDLKTGFGDSSQNLGLTAHVIHDSRDFALNASRGRLIEFNLSGYSDNLASDESFQKLAMTYSEYKPVGNATFAWQVQTELSHGDVPWDQLAHLGGSRKLRGYEEGRYRDEQLLMAQAEWRQPIYGRHGAVAWAGVGTLSEDIDELGKEKWLHSVGVGYRFAIKPKVNLRLDLGFGNGDKGAYFSVNEVF